jgi:hypothetical protein
MACCIIAAFLIAQAVATLRRWGMFWGLVAVPEGAVVDTAMARVQGWLALPRVRLAVAVIAIVELGVVANWAYFEHGEHIYQIADQTYSAFRGERVVYIGMCGPDGQDRMVRVVLADAGETSGFMTLTN